MDTELVASCYWLLSHWSRLKSTWSWAEIFPLLTSREMEMRFIVIEILRLLFTLSETRVGQLRSQFLAGVSWSAWVLKYNIKDVVTISMLAQDTTQQHMEHEKTKVVTLKHVSLAKVGPSITSM